MKKNTANLYGKTWTITLILVMLLVGGLYYLKQQDSNLLKKSSVNSAINERTPTKQQKPQFDFYNVLPGSPTGTPTKTVQAKPATATVKSNNIAAIPAPAKTKNVAVIKSNQYYLQVISVKNYADADSLKANLILQGYNTSITKVTVGQEVRYRVMIGPYASLTNAQVDQKALRTNNINSMVITAK